MYKLHYDNFLINEHDDACFLFVIVDWYTRNITVVEISHETPRLACFAYPHKCKKASFSRTAAHIFVSPGDAPALITQYVAWMERQFSACQTPRSMYPSICNSFLVIQTPSAKNRRFHVPQPTFLFPLETPL